MGTAVDMVASCRAPPTVSFSEEPGDTASPTLRRGAGRIHTCPALLCPVTNRLGREAIVHTTIIGQERAGKLAKHELGRIRTAAHHAARVYPGPVGELLARELHAHADFRYQFGTDGLIARLAAEILATRPE
jgi:hypothetical protein